MKESSTPEQILDLRFQEIQDKINAMICQDVEVAHAKIRFMYRHSINYLNLKDFELKYGKKGLSDTVKQFFDLVNQLLSDSHLK